MDYCITYSVDKDDINVYLDGVNIVTFTCLSDKDTLHTLLIRLLTNTTKNNAVFIITAKPILQSDSLAYCVNFKEVAKVDVSYEILQSAYHFLAWVSTGKTTISGLVDATMIR